MKYSIKYYKGCTILDNADEIIIEYNKRGVELIKFCGKYSNKSIVIDITNNQSPLDFDIFKECPNLTIKLSINQSVLLFADLKELKIPFFYAEEATTWDSLIYQLEDEPNQVYISGELGFDLARVKEICDKSKTEIRCYPNVAQYSGIKSPMNTFKNFFIPPSALKYYSNFIDTLEFYGNSLDKQDVLYRIYNDESWNDDLSVLLLDLNEKNIYDNIIPPYVWNKRTNCRKECYKQNTCHACDEALIFSKTMYDKNYIFENIKNL